MCVLCYFSEICSSVYRIAIIIPLLAKFRAKLEKEKKFVVNPWVFGITQRNSEALIVSRPSGVILQYPQNRGKMAGKKKDIVITPSTKKEEKKTTPAEEKPPAALEPKAGSNQAGSGAQTDTGKKKSKKTKSSVTTVAPTTVTPTVTTVTSTMTSVTTPVLGGAIGRGGKPILSTMTGVTPGTGVHGPPSATPQQQQELAARDSAILATGQVPVLPVQPTVQQGGGIFTPQKLFDTQQERELSQPKTQKQKAQEAAQEEYERIQAYARAKVGAFAAEQIMKEQQFVEMREAARVAESTAKAEEARRVQLEYEENARQVAAEHAKMQAEAAEAEQKAQQAEAQRQLDLRLAQAKVVESRQAKAAQHALITQQLVHTHIDDTPGQLNVPPVVRDALAPQAAMSDESLHNRIVQDEASIRRQKDAKASLDQRAKLAKQDFDDSPTKTPSPGPTSSGATGQSSSMDTTERTDVQSQETSDTVTSTRVSESQSDTGIMGMLPPGLPINRLEQYTPYAPVFTGPMRYNDLPSTGTVRYVAPRDDQAQSPLYRVQGITIAAHALKADEEAAVPVPMIDPDEMEMDELGDQGGVEREDLLLTEEETNRILITPAIYQLRVASSDADIDDTPQPVINDKTQSFLLPTPNRDKIDPLDRPVELVYTPMREMEVQGFHNGIDPQAYKEIEACSIYTNPQFARNLNMDVHPDVWARREALAWQDLWYNADWGKDMYLIRHAFKGTSRSYVFSTYCPQSEVGKRVYERLRRLADHNIKQRFPVIKFMHSGEPVYLCRDTIDNLQYKMVCNINRENPSYLDAEVMRLQKIFKKETAQKHTKAEKKALKAKEISLPAPMFSQDTVTNPLTLLGRTSENKEWRKAVLKKEWDKHISDWKDKHSKWTDERLKIEDTILWTFLQQQTGSASDKIPGRVGAPAIRVSGLVEPTHQRRGFPSLHFGLLSLNYGHSVRKPRCDVEPDSAEEKVTHEGVPLFQGSTRTTNLPPDHYMGQWPEVTKEVLVQPRRLDREKGPETSVGPLGHFYGNPPNVDVNSGARRLLADHFPLNINLAMACYVSHGNCGRDALHPENVGKTTINWFRRLPKVKQAAWGQRMSLLGPIVILKEMQALRGMYPVTVPLSREHTDVILLCRYGIHTALPPYIDFCPYGGQMFDALDRLRRSGYLDVSGRRCYGLMTISMDISCRPFYTRADPECTKQVSKNMKAAKTVGDEMAISDFRALFRTGEKLSKSTVGSEWMDTPCVGEIPFALAIYSFTEGVAAIIPTYHLRFGTGDAHECTRRRFIEWIDDVNAYFFCGRAKEAAMAMSQVFDVNLPVDRMLPWPHHYAHLEHDSGTKSCDYDNPSPEYDNLVDMLDRLAGTKECESTYHTSFNMPTSIPERFPLMDMMEAKNHWSPDLINHIGQRVSMEREAVVRVMFQVDHSKASKCDDLIKGEDPCGDKMDLRAARVTTEKYAAWFDLREQLHANTNVPLTNIKEVLSAKEWRAVGSYWTRELIEAAKYVYRKLFRVSKIFCDKIMEEKQSWIDQVVAVGLDPPSENMYMRTDNTVHHTLDEKYPGVCQPLGKVTAAQAERLWDDGNLAYMETPAEELAPSIFKIGFPIILAEFINAGQKIQNVNGMNSADKSLLLRKCINKYLHNWWDINAYISMCPASSGVNRAVSEWNGNLYIPATWVKTELSPKTQVNGVVYRCAGGLAQEDKLQVYIIEPDDYVLMGTRLGEEEEEVSATGRSLVIDAGHFSPAFNESYITGAPRNVVRDYIRECPRIYSDTFKPDVTFDHDGIPLDRNRMAYYEVTMPLEDGTPEVSKRNKQGCFDKDKDVKLEDRKEWTFPPPRDPTMVYVRPEEPQCDRYPPPLTCRGDRKGEGARRDDVQTEAFLERANFVHIRQRGQNLPGVDPCWIDKEKEYLRDKRIPGARTKPTGDFNQPFGAWNIFGFSPSIPPGGAQGGPSTSQYGQPPQQRRPSGGGAPGPQPPNKKPNTRP